MSPWKQTYWVVWVANLVTAVGMMSFLPFFPAHLAKLGVAEQDIAVWTGVIFGAAPLVASVMTPIWSALGDRFGRRLMTVRAMLAITLFVGAMAFATSPWHLLALRLAQGCFSGFIAPSITLVSVIAPIHKQGVVAGSLQTALALGSVIGPLIGGAVIIHHGLETVFVGVSVLSLVAAALVWFFALENATDRRHVESGTSPRTVLRSIITDLVEVWRHPRLRPVLQIVFWSALGIGATNPLMLLFIGELGVPVGRSEVLTGILLSCVAGVNLIAMPLWGRFGDRKGHGAALRWCTAIAALMLLLHAATWNVESLFVFRLALAVAMAGSTPLAYGLAAQEISVDRRGGAMGAVFSSRTLAIALSSMVGGALSAWVGIRGLFFLSGVVLVVVLVLATGLRRKQVA